MKSFVIAVTLLSVIIGFTAYSAVWFGNSTKNLLKRLQTLPEIYDSANGNAEMDRQMEDIYQLWDKSVPSMSYTVGYVQINRADTAFNTMYISYFSGNYDDYAISRREALDAVKRLSRLQGLHTDSIF